MSEIFMEPNPSYKLFETFAEVGTAELDSGDPERALVVFTAMEEMGHELGDNLMIMSGMAHSAEALDRLDRDEEANAKLEIAYELAAKLGLVEPEVETVAQKLNAQQ